MPHFLHNTKNNVSRISGCIVTAMFSFLIVYGQQRSDSLKLPPLDSSANIKFECSRFPAANPELRTTADSTTKSFLPIPNDVGPGLSNSYTITYRPYYESAIPEFFSHGMNSKLQGISYLEQYEFLSPNKPFSEISTTRRRAVSNSQGGFQDNFDLDLIFAAQFNYGILWNLSYDRQIYKGIYSHEKQRNTLFKTGVHFASKNSPIQLSAMYADDRQYMEDNWGVTSDSLLQLSDYAIRESVPVHNYNALSSGYRRSIGLLIDYARNKDSTGFLKSVYLHSYLSKYAYDYLDNNTNENDSLYGIFYIDSFLNFTFSELSYKNSLLIDLYQSRKWGIKASFTHEYISRSFEELLSTYNKWSIKGIGIFKWNEGYLMSSQIEITNYKEKWYPDVRLEWKANWNTMWDINISAFSYEKPVSLLYQTLYLNNKEFWNQNFSFKDTRHTGLKFDATWNFRTTVMLGTDVHLTDQFLYLDTLSRPASAGQTHSMKFYAGVEMHYGVLHFQPKLSYHSQNKDPLGMNGWTGTAALSVSTNIFSNKVHTDLGARCHILDYRKKLRYNPILQLFYASEQQGERILPLDFIAHFKVEEFSFLLELENIDSFWTRRQTLIESYPIYDFMLKIGINWRFVN